MPRDGSPRVRSLIALGAGVAVLAGLGACTSGSSSPATTAPGSTTARSASGSSGPSGSPAPSTSAASATSAGSATSTASAARSSASRLPTTDPSPLTTVPTSAVHTLRAVPLSSPAAFGTGVSARVTSVTHGTDHDKGPGAAAGQPTVLFHLRLINGSSKPVSVADVQVLATYGSAKTPAIADNGATKEFTGTVHPGGDADAVYSFAVPSSGQQKVALTVTYTAGQPTVLLTGSAR